MDPVSSDPVKYIFHMDLNRNKRSVFCTGAAYLRKRNECRHENAVDHADPAVPHHGCLPVSVLRSFQCHKRNADAFSCYMGKASCVSAKR